MTTDSVLFPLFVRQGKSRTRFKVGYMNRLGETVIAAIFDDGTRFSEGLAAVRVKSHWGVINASGNFIIQPKLWNWCRFRDGLASLAARNGKWGVIDRAGNVIVQPKYDSIGPFEDGLALIRIGDREKARYCFIDKTGAEVILPKFHDAQDFSEGLAAVKVANLWGYIAPSGAFKITPRFDGTGLGKRWPDVRAGRFVNRLAPVWCGQENYRFINTAGCHAFEGSFDDANSFSEERAVVKRDNRFGFIDTDGSIRSSVDLLLHAIFRKVWRGLRRRNLAVDSFPRADLLTLTVRWLFSPCSTVRRAFGMVCAL